MRSGCSGLVDEAALVDAPIAGRIAGAAPRRRRRRADHSGRGQFRWPCPGRRAQPAAHAAHRRPDEAGAAQCRYEGLERHPGGAERADSPPLRGARRRQILRNASKDPSQGNNGTDWSLRCNERAASSVALYSSRAAGMPGSHMIPTRESPGTISRRSFKPLAGEFRGEAGEAGDISPGDGHSTTNLDRPPFDFSTVGPKAAMEAS